MSIVSWNCQGVAANTTVSELKDLYKKIKPAIIFLMEIRAKQCNIRKLKRELRFDKFFCVEPWELFRGLSLLWNKNMNLDIYSWCHNVIKAYITDRKGNKWDCCFVYGDLRQRKKQWRDLVAQNQNQNEPQLFIGDYNDILNQEEKVGLHPKPREKMKEFRKFVNGNRLMDIDLKGGKFTWFSNPRNGFVTRERLDRVLVNWNWRRLYQNVTLTALPAIGSDHCPLVLRLEPREKFERHFKFEAYWEDHEDCEKIIKQGWEKNENKRNKWEKLQGKFKSCKKELEQ
ncbi:hypothetical protein Ahy_A10g050058 isoform B [Arachis hypogaea]|uniref:Endonuclease/exonuclease/phosphatase domain-containing protein n=3 Tax=Arachis TaxID=3817 RepID=A0A445B8J3_ARAHY|nr:hypothetical protein Ahy_A10g050058 isoform B [Arachis hypogaea]